MIRTDTTFAWFPMLKAIEAEQLRREAPLLAKIEANQEKWTAAWAEIMQIAATASETIADVTARLEEDGEGS